MTDRLTPAADDLVERLRLAKGSGFGRVVAVMQHEAADKIEAQAQEIAQNAVDIEEYQRDVDALKARVARLTTLLRPHACNPDNCECAAMDWDKSQCKALVILNVLAEDSDAG